MSYMILCRTGRGALIAIIDADKGEDVIAEYESEAGAEKAARNTMACHAFPYEIIEVPL